MKRLITPLLCAIALFASDNTFAGYRSGSSTSSARPSSPSVSRPTVSAPSRPSGGSIFSKPSSPTTAPSNRAPGGSVFGSNTKPSTPPSATVPSNSAPKWGTSTGTQPKPQSTATSAALAQKQQMTPVKPKDEYVKEFQQKNANTIKNDFKTEPTTRPSYVPSTYQNHTVIFYGGRYGYYDPLGHFLALETNILLQNAAMASYQRDIAYSNNGYVQPVVVSSGGHAFLYVFISIFLVIVIVSLVATFGTTRTYY